MRKRAKVFWWWLRMALIARRYYGCWFPISSVTSEDGCWQSYYDSGLGPHEAVMEDLSYA
jgi:hypothetical protein